MSHVGEKPWEDGRIVRATPWVLWTGHGFLHWCDGQDGERDRGWYITRGWRYFDEGVHKLSPQVEMAGQGLVVGDQVVYKWAEHPYHKCTPGCPACIVRQDDGAERFTCRLVPRLHRIAPGHHNCALDQAGMFLLIREQQKVLGRLEREADRAAQERDRQRELVDMLKRNAV